LYTITKRRVVYDVDSLPAASIQAFAPSRGACSQDQRVHAPLLAVKVLLPRLCFRTDPHTFLHRNVVLFSSTIRLCFLLLTMKPVGTIVTSSFPIISSFLFLFRHSFIELLRPLMLCHLHVLRPPLHHARQPAFLPRLRSMTLLHHALTPIRKRGVGSSSSGVRSASFCLRVQCCSLREIAQVVAAVEMAEGAAAEIAFEVVVLGG
jgi:hypothetical protein